jgi:hypothetical protein
MTPEQVLAVVKEGAWFGCALVPTAREGARVS